MSFDAPSGSTLTSGNAQGDIDVGAFPTKIAGRPAKEIRTLLHFCGRCWFAERVALNRKCSVRAAQRLMRRLHAEGYVEPDIARSMSGAQRTQRRIRWQRTALGQKLTCAHLGKRIKRATAVALLDGVLERVGELNALPYTVKYVSKLYVFGSFLDSRASTLGDVDLAIEWKPRPGAEGRDFVAAGDWGTAYHRHIRGRSTYISLHDLSDAKSVGAKLKLLVELRDEEVRPFDRELFEALA